MNKLKCTILAASLCLISAQANALGCRGHVEKEVSRIYSEITRKTRASDQNTYQYCLMWINDINGYTKLANKLNAEPCPGKSKDWKNIKAILTQNMNNVLGICQDSNKCSNGCGNAKSIIMSGRSFQEAMATIPD